MGAAMKQRHWLRDFWRGYSNVVLVLCCSILLLQDIFGAHGLMAMRQSQRETVRVHQEIDRLNDENREIQAHIHALKTDPTTIECIARAQMGLTRPGESVFKLPGSASDTDDPCLEPSAPRTPPAVTPPTAAP